MEKAEAIAVEMKKYLDKHDGVDKRLPCFVGISGFDNFAVNIAVLVSHAIPLAVLLMTEAVERPQ